jgi:hypothetical protein
MRHRTDCRRSQRSTNRNDDALKSGSLYRDVDKGRDARMQWKGMQTSRPSLANAADCGHCARLSPIK